MNKGLHKACFALDFELLNSEFSIGMERLLKGKSEDYICGTLSAFEIFQTWYPKAMGLWFKHFRFIAK